MATAPRPTPVRPDPFLQLPRAQQMLALRRADAVRLAEAAYALGKAAGRHQRDVTPDVLRVLAGLGVPCGRSTLDLGRRHFRADGVAGLTDFRKADRQRWHRLGPFFLELERVYTAGLVRKADAHARTREAAEVMGWPVATLRDSASFLDRYIVPHVTRERGDGGGFDGGSDRTSNDIRGS